jgi:hypothetical protein
LAIAIADWFEIQEMKVPAHIEVYLMGNVLTDWDDDEDDTLMLQEFIQDCMTATADMQRHVRS